MPSTETVQRDIANLADQCLPRPFTLRYETTTQYGTGREILTVIVGFPEYTSNAAAKMVKFYNWLQNPPCDLPEHIHVTPDLTPWKVTHGR